MPKPKNDKHTLVLTIEGAPEHRGHPMAHALVEKLDRFLKAFAGFERARIGKRVRQTDFEIVRLEHNSPAQIGLKPVTRVPSYTPGPVVVWTLDQWEKISLGQRPDDEVDEDLIGAVAEMASVPENAEYSAFRVSYGTQKIELNETTQRNALALRTVVTAERRKLPWMTGMSLGTLTGELKTVMDAHNERRLILVPPVGPGEVRCNFTDDLREQIRGNLFKFVRVTGTLHYSDKSAFPYLVDVEKIESLEDEAPRPHLRAGRGLFKESQFGPEPADWP